MSCILSGTFLTKERIYNLTLETNSSFLMCFSVLFWYLLLLQIICQIDIDIEWTSTVYNSYTDEKASTLIKSISLKNTSQSYSIMNQLKYNVSNEMHKYLMYMQFVAWDFKGCSVAPITDYANNSIFQELPTQNEYTSMKNCT